MKTRKSKWSEIFDTHYGKLYAYPKSPCQVSEKFIIGKVDCFRGWANRRQKEQVLLLFGMLMYVIIFCPISSLR